MVSSTEISTTRQSSSLTLKALKDGVENTQPMFYSLLSGIANLFLSLKLLCFDIANMDRKNLDVAIRDLPLEITPLTAVAHLVSSFETGHGALLKGTKTIQLKVKKLLDDVSSAISTAEPQDRFQSDIKRCYSACFNSAKAMTTEIQNWALNIEQAEKLFTTAKNLTVSEIVSIKKREDKLQNDLESLKKKLKQNDIDTNKAKKQLQDEHSKGKPGHTATHGEAFFAEKVKAGSQWKTKTAGIGTESKPEKNGFMSPSFWSDWSIKHQPPTPVNVPSNDWQEAQKNHFRMPIEDDVCELRWKIEGFEKQKKETEWNPPTPVNVPSNDWQKAQQNHFRVPIEDDIRELKWKIEDLEKQKKETEWNIKTTQRDKQKLASQKNQLSEFRFQAEQCIFLLETMTEMCKQKLEKYCGLLTKFFGEDNKNAHLSLLIKKEGGTHQLCSLWFGLSGWLTAYNRIGKSVLSKYLQEASTMHVTSQIVESRTKIEKAKDSVDCWMTDVAESAKAQILSDALSIVKKLETSFYDSIASDNLKC